MFSHFGALGRSALVGAAALLSVSVARGAQPSAGFEITAFALGAALLGGTSAYGRRGGIFGTVLAAALVTVGVAYAGHTRPGWSPLVLAAVAIGLGLAVTRLVERFGRPAPASPDESEDDWAPRVHSATTSPTSNGWASTTTRPATQSTVGSLWASDDSWGTTPR